MGMPIEATKLVTHTAAMKTKSKIALTKKASPAKGTKHESKKNKTKTPLKKEKGAHLKDLKKRLKNKLPNKLPQNGLWSWPLIKTPLIGLAATLTITGLFYGYALLKDLPQIPPNTASPDTLYSPQKDQTAVKEPEKKDMELVLKEENKDMEGSEDMAEGLKEENEDRERSKDMEEALKEENEDREEVPKGDKPNNNDEGGKNNWQRSTLNTIYTTTRHC